RYYTEFHAIPEYRQEFENITRHVFRLSHDEKVQVYGAKLFATEKSDKSALIFAVVGLLPTYVFAYVVFIFCCLKIYRAINSYEISNKSQKTIEMQQQFFKTLLLQGLLPLVVLAIPLGCFFVGLAGGFDLDRLTLFLTFSLWTVPTVQGLVSLSFVVKMKTTSNARLSSTRNQLDQRS
ncbi:hypothetical protein PENTCL1PPCAC_24813, partial [Pristionchus entomophagus]